MAVFFAAQIFRSRFQEAADPGSVVFWIILAVGCLLAGIGYFLKARWIIALGAVPIILLSAFIALTSLVGGWIWGPREAGLMNFLILGGFGFTLIQLFGLVLAFFLAKRHSEGPQSPGP
jgi:hypothetical protein